MQKTILITGSTDGIGLEAAKMLHAAGHTVLLHGRNPKKLENAKQELSQLSGGGRIEGFVADLSRMADVVALATAVTNSHERLDALINNAGIYGPGATTDDGLDVRFAVNTVAPYLLTQRLIPLLAPDSRVINVSSAAQSPVDLSALTSSTKLSDGAAYAQSKLAITMWSHSLALSRGTTGPVIIAVNPASMLGSKMVKEAFGVAGGDIRIGADILKRLTLEDEFASATGKYFDNDIGRFGPPHADALNAHKCEQVERTIEELLGQLVPNVQI